MILEKNASEKLSEMDIFIIRRALNIFVLPRNLIEGWRKGFKSAHFGIKVSYVMMAGCYSAFPTLFVLMFTVNPAAC